ncbi:MAG: YhcH/YjgK/YiaL family protein [Muricoprocola sp.]
MIIDKFENIRFYSSMLKNLENGLEAVAALKSREPGRYEFEGGYFMVQKGTTKPLEEGTYEAHRKYTDVQIILEGSEEIAWKEITDLASVKEYDSEKDAERLEGSFDHVMKITEGMFYAAFPHDGHKPVSHTSEQQEYTKIVMKLPAK